MQANSVAVSAGGAFAVSGRNGDIHQLSAEGFYAHDTRFLSKFLLTVGGKEPALLGSSQLGPALASFYASSRTRNLPEGTISVVRDRYVSQGLHEDISLINHSITSRAVRLELTFDADFADIFEVRSGPVRKAGKTRIETRENQHLCLVYQRGKVHRETWITFSIEPEIQGKTAIFDVTLEPKGTWTTCVSVLPVLSVLTGVPSPMLCVQTVLEEPFGSKRGPAVVHLSDLKRPGTKAPPEEVPTLRTNLTVLHTVYDQAITDLRSLRMEGENDYYILAAGLPWFMAIFGRDAIISALQTKLLGPELMIGTLDTLANLQFKRGESDASGDAQPGKIPHEIRGGGPGSSELFPQARYYDSVDATPLFLILLWEAYQWTGDAELLRRFLPAAEEALQWIDQYGDMDNDGFIEYQYRSKSRLLNQCWKDSWDSISFADGELAQGPIAVVEVQGYVYDAKRKMAEAYRMLQDPAKARKLDQEAQRLKVAFNKAFWMPDKGYYAVALDGRKEQVDSITSNPGHCLWSGIVEEDKAAKVAERLLAPDMFTGWGIRTLSSDMVRYNPVSYHNGSVWPHDNSLIAAGLARYGFIDEAEKVISGLFRAASDFPDKRLPELFAGYPRREYSFPVPYPATNAPQAWAAGAIIYLLETLLRVTPAGDRLMLEALTEGLSVSLSGVRYRGSRRVL